MRDRFRLLRGFLVLIALNTVLLSENKTVFKKNRIT